VVQLSSYSHLLNVARVQHVGYTLGDGWKTWPKKQSLSNFARRSCRPLATQIIRDYFDLLWPRFLELKQRVGDLVLSAQYELQKLSGMLDEYQSSLATGADFVR